ncbi:hypothetical protein FKM82_010420 [Ascaphus truei]
MFIYSNLIVDEQIQRQITDTIICILVVAQIMNNMAFSGEKTVFPPSTSNYQSLYNTSRSFEALAPTLSRTTPSNDDLGQDRPRSRTFLDSPRSSTCGISTPRLQHMANSGVHKSLQSSFNDTNETAQTFKKPSLQEQYWASVIPDSLPPCPDRGSPHWDPNKEYQDLLDYTYPLNPKYFIYKGSDDGEITDPFFHDSGIDLDSYNVSCGSKLQSVGSPCPEEHEGKRFRYPRTNHLSSPYAFSTPFKTPVYRDLQNPSDSSNEASFEELSPCASKVDLTKDSTSSFYLPKYSVYEECKSLGSVSEEKLSKPGQFIPTTKILPLRKDWSSDEEFLSLPPNFKELENLATHLKDLSLRIGKNGYMNGGQGEVYRQNWLLSEYAGEKGRGTKKSNAPENLHYSGPDFKSDGSGSKINPPSQCHTGSTLNKFSSLRDMLDGFFSSHLLETAGCSPMEKGQENGSLVQSIQTFCHHLDKLIQWLYSVAEITDNWIPPKPNVESIQLSLSLYLKFKKDIAEQQTLADTVVKDGELLLKCMSLHSSVLKDTLGLISKQSEELDRHAKRLYASVLGAMDTVTDDGLRRNRDKKQCVSLEMESS